MGSGCTCASLSCCGCCQGITQKTPQAIENRPSLNAIAYRAGTYSTFYQTLLARIAQSRQPGLRQLRTREPGDFTIALLDAVSVMGDVLTFYSERIANEAYLGTATERRSVAWLANLVGYRMSPGVAADACLAFTIDPSAGAFGAVINTPPNPMLAQAFSAPHAAPPGPRSMPAQLPSIVIPRGTQVKSVAGPGQMPQTYETVDQIDGRPEWNAIPPRLYQPQEVSASAPSILLSGSVTTLQKGDWLLRLPAGTVQLAPVQVYGVTVSPDGKTTRVDLALDPLPGSWPGYQPDSFADGLASGASHDSEATLQSATGLPAVAAMLADPTRWWDAGDILTAAKANRWPLDQLGALVNQLIAQTANVQGSVYVFRQQAAPFGFNAPNYYSLPAPMRYENTFASSSPPNGDVPAAYPASQAWDANSNVSPPASEFTLDGWGGVLYLDSVYSQIVPGSSVVLLANGADPTAFEVASNTTVTHADFTISAKVSKLTLKLNSPSDLSPFELRSTTILCQAEALPLAQVPITQASIGGGSANAVMTLGGAYLGLMPGHQVVVSGTTQSKSSGNLAGPPAAEVHALSQVQVCGGFTVITLDAPLQNIYTRATVCLNANVAAATHGQTVSETIGSGDGTQAFQSFMLHQAPLTYVHAENTAGSASTLQVFVDGMEWSEVPFFYGHGPSEHIYITAQDDSGITTVTFGDGDTGSRLPTGTANIAATYRFGSGTPGLVNADQLSQLMSRPLGVRSVNNPLPSTGAADPQDLDSGRATATLPIMTLGRIVSLQDYQDFALAFPGIGKALATWTWDGQRRMVALTVAAAAGPLLQTDSTIAALQGSIARCSEPNVDVAVLAYAPIYFKIEAAVQISSSAQVALLQPALEAALRNAFSFSARSFGQPVYQSEVIAAIQDVAGVLDVVLTMYSSSDFSNTPRQQLAASLPQTGGRGNLLPAQLLTLDPGPLALTVTKVSS